MSALMRRPNRPLAFYTTPLLVAATIALSVLMGVLLPLYAEIALLGLAAVVIIVLILVRPVIGVYLVTFSFLIQNAITIGAVGTGSKWLGMYVFFAWLVAKFIRRESLSRVLSARILIPGIVFVLFCLASMLWAYSTVTIPVGVMTLAQLLAFSILVLDTITSWRKLENLVGFLVLGGIIAALMVISQYLSGTVARAGDDISGGINETAYLLTMVVAFSFYLVRAPTNFAWRLAGLVYLALGPIAVIFTYSRTSYVALVLVLASQVWDMARSSMVDRIRIIIVGSILVVALLGSGIIDWDKVLDRSSTITPELSEESQAGRVQHWRGAIAIFLDHPFVGAGYDNFGYMFRSYQFLVPGNFVFRMTRSPHSTVFGLLSEIGLIGVGLLVFIWLIALYNTARGWRQNKYRRNPHFSFMVALFYILLLYAYYAPVSIIHTSKLLWLMIGFSEVVRNLTEGPGANYPSTEAEIVPAANFDSAPYLRR